MAVTFEIKDAKKATEVVIEVTEIVKVECFNVAFTISIISPSSRKLSRQSFGFCGILMCSPFCVSCDGSFLSIAPFAKFVKLDEGYFCTLARAFAYSFVHVLTNMNVSSAPTPRLKAY